jgi:REP element-mobilizing transposase RayT
MHLYRACGAMCISGAALNAPYVRLVGACMPDYRRVFVPGGEYFFTVNLEDRSSDLLVRRIADLRAAWLHIETRFPFETVAAVVLPDHLHCIWRLPPGDRNFPVRWRMLKGCFTRALVRVGLAPEGRRQANATCGSAAFASTPYATRKTDSAMSTTSTTTR